jgi:transketolase
MINYFIENKEKIATRKAYGDALVKIGGNNELIAVLDAETSNSTFADKFKLVSEDRFVECFIAEQNMVSVATGLSRKGLIPFVSGFAAFLGRAFDQIRMSQYSDTNIKFVGSHCGVSIGDDGASQMALEDIAMFRSIQDLKVLYPFDYNSTLKLVELCSKENGNFYIRITRADTPSIYDDKEIFEIGRSKSVVKSENDEITIVAAGITLLESYKAVIELSKENINCHLIDLYSIKPLDSKTIIESVQNTKKLLVVEDHHPQGGIGEAVLSEIAGLQFDFGHLAVKKRPVSGKPSELLEFCEIDSKAVYQKVKSML